MPTPPSWLQMPEKGNPGALCVAQQIHPVTGMDGCPALCSDSVHTGDWETHDWRFGFCWEQVEMGCWDAGVASSHLLIVEMICQMGLCQKVTGRQGKRGDFPTYRVCYILLPCQSMWLGVPLLIQGSPTKIWGTHLQPVPALCIASQSGEQP